MRLRLCWGILRRLQLQQHSPHASHDARDGCHRQHHRTPRQPKTSSERQGCVQMTTAMIQPALRLITCMSGSKKTISKYPITN